MHPQHGWPERSFWQRLDPPEHRHRQVQSAHRSARGSLEGLPPREAAELGRPWQRCCEVLAELERPTAAFWRPPDAALRLFLGSPHTSPGSAQRELWLEFLLLPRGSRAAVRRPAQFCPRALRAPDGVQSATAVTAFPGEISLPRAFQAHLRL